MADNGDNTVDTAFANAAKAEGILSGSNTLSFPDLDIAKLIMAFLVVEIHTKPFNDLGSETIARIVSGIDCVAVPFFFIASGFLCFRGLSIKDFDTRSSAAAVRVRKNIRKQLSLYAIWTVVLLPLALFGAHLREWGAAETILRLVRGVVFVGENDFTWPLWYLLASVVAFLLVYILLRGGGVSQSDFARFRGVSSVRLRHRGLSRVGRRAPCDCSHGRSV